MKNSLAGQYLIMGASSDIGCELIRHLESNPSNRIMAISRSNFDPLKVGLSTKHKYLSGFDFTHERDLEDIRTHVTAFFDKPFTAIHSVGDFWVHKPLVDTSLAVCRREAQVVDYRHE